MAPKVTSQNSETRRFGNKLLKFPQGVHGFFYNSQLGFTISSMSLEIWDPIGQQTFSGSEISDIINSHKLGCRPYFLFKEVNINMIGLMIVNDKYQ